MRLITLLLCTFSCATICIGQVDPNPRYRSFTDTDFIRTDPSNPLPAYDASIPWKTNTFDWRQRHIPYAHTESVCRSDEPDFLNSIDNYFWGFIPGHSTRKASDSDFQPIDGWELVQRNFGYLMRPGQMQESAAPSIRNGRSARIAYVILYNRYTGVLRVMATPLHSPPSNNKMMVEVKFALNAQKNNASALLQQINNESRALDKVTVAEAQRATTTPALQCDAFYMADFQMSYDPCNCKTKSNLIVTFSYVEEATFEATGIGLGVTKDLRDFISTNPPEYVLPNYSNQYFNALFHNNKPAGGFFFQSATSAMSTYENKTLSNVELSKAFKYVGKVLAIGAKAAGLLDGSETFIKALELISGVTDFASMATEQSKPSKAPLMLIESELRLTGSIEEVTTDLNNVVAFTSPGS